MNVLSLFDGMSCGQIALERAGVKVNNYYASEIEKGPIFITRKNYPTTLHIGDIQNIKGHYLPKIDLIIGGSPCQGFSSAGKGLNFKDPRSKLFFEFVRLVKECKPKYFLLENVRMKQEWLDIISKHLGVEPHRINSERVSAGKRDRYYWTNIPDVTLPEYRDIFLKDVIEHGLVDKEKAYCLDANYFKGTNLEQYLKKKRRQVVFNYSSSGRGLKGVECRFYESVKAQTLTKTGYSKRSFTGVYNQDGIRKLTPLECERIQTVPEGYTSGVSNSQRYKMLGNGWTVDVIAHILKNITGTGKTKDV